MKRATKAVAGRSNTSRGGCLLDRPSFMITMISASAIASSWLWVTCTKVMPSVFCSFFSSARMRIFRNGSSADSGSSSSSASDR
jgi:hypothetical protein